MQQGRKNLQRIRSRTEVIHLQASLRKMGRLQKTELHPKPKTQQELECAGIIQGTIAAAAVLNEMIAVVVAKKGFEWAGEIPGQGNPISAQEKPM